MSGSLPQNEFLPNKPWQSIRALRGIAAIAIVFFHTWEMLITYTEGKGFFHHFDKVWQHGAAGVDLFFIISGFIIVHSTRGKFNSLKNGRIFLQKRAIRILPLYWIYSTIFLLLVLYPDTLKRTLFSLQYTIFSFLLIPTVNPANGLDLPLLPQGWTLSYELYFYLIFALLLSQKERLLLPWITFVFVSSVCVGFFIDSENPLVTVLVNPLLLEFVMGCYLAYFIRSTSMKNRLCYGMLFIGCVCMVLTGIFQPPINYRLISYGIPCFFFMAGLVYLEKNQPVRFPHILLKLGDSSYSLYLSHIFVILVISTLLKTQTLPWFFNNDGIVLITVIICLIVGHISYIIFERKLFTRIRSWVISY